MILVSHDTRDAMLIADRIAYIEDGFLLQIDTPEVIYNQPKTLAIAQFFGRVNELKRSDGSTLFARAEHLQQNVSENAFQAKVESCTFLGNYNLCRARTELGKSVVFYSNEVLISNLIITKPIC